MKHKLTQVGPAQENSERYSLGACMGAEAFAAALSRTNAPVPSLMEAVVERGNMRLAYQRVVENKGAPGVDGLRVDELKNWLIRNWPTVASGVACGQLSAAAGTCRRDREAFGRNQALRHPDGGGPTDSAGDVASTPTDL